MTLPGDEIDGADREKAGRLDHSGGEASEASQAAPPSGAGAAAQQSATAGETETVDRDALHQADYGGVREPAGVPEPAAPQEDRQGGAAADEAGGGGRKPTGDRDRDYDPDGDQAGL